MSARDLLDAGDRLHERLSGWFRQRLADPAARLESLERIAAGQSNLTYAATVRFTQVGEARTLACILRCDPIEGPQAPYDIPGQFGMFQALRRAGAPVPEPYWLETDPAWIGRDFYACAYVRHDPVGRLLDPADPLTGPRTEAFVETLAAIHGLDWRSGGVERHAPVVGPGDLEALIDRERRFFPAVPNDDLAFFERARARLLDERPADFELRLNHGDCTLSNYLFQGERIAAVVDWELSLITDRMFDVGYYCAALFRFQSERPTAEVEAQRVAFLDLYRRASGASLETLPFWEKLSNFRNALSWTQSAFAGLTSAYPLYRDRLAILMS